MSRPAHLLWRGNFSRPSGFTYINQRLVSGLRARGYRLSTADIDTPEQALTADLPEFYLFHGDPQDLEQAPARYNVYYLQWEYQRVPPRWVEALNARFDLVLAPTAFSADRYRESGVETPVAVCPGGVDFEEFNPDASPWAVPPAGFRFIYLGGAHARRGTDVLLRAYAREFRSSDDVLLILKAFHYRHHEPWLRRALAAFDEQSAPAIHYVHDTVASVAGAFTAADVGVFPLRAESTGLPILECLACGRPIISTAGTAVAEYGRADTMTLVSATPHPASERAGWEPDEDDLRRRMREAYEGGSLDDDARARIARSVAAWSWSRSVERLNQSLTRLRDGEADARPPRSPRPHEPLPDLGWGNRGRAHAGCVQRCLDRPRARGKPFLAAASGSALSAWNRTVATGPRLLHSAGLARESEIALERAERARCDMPEAGTDQFELWRHRHERRLADAVVVLDERAGDTFHGQGVPREKLVVAPPVARPAPWPRPSYGGDHPTRILFASSHPFRDGIRCLLEAWSAVAPDAAELHCAVGKEPLASRRLLRALVSNPGIIIHDAPPRLTHEAWTGLLESADWLVHPSPLDGQCLGVVAAMSAGRPALLSPTCSISVHCRDGEGTHLLSGPEPTDIAAGLDEILTRPQRYRGLGESAWRWSRDWTTERFRARVLEAVRSLTGDEP